MRSPGPTRNELSDPADALRRIDDVLRLVRSVVWEIDSDGVFTYVSPSIEDVLGYRPEEVVGIRTIHDFYPPDLPPFAKKEVSPGWLREAREFTNSEVPLLTKSGDIVWVASDGKPIFDEDGNHTGFRGADTDITPRKQMETLLIARERRLLELITAAPVPMAYTMASGDGKMSINRAFATLFGYAQEEIPTIEEWFRRAYPDEDYRAEILRRNNDLFLSLTAGQRVTPAEYRITCKDGRVLEVEIDAAIVGDCFVGTFIDVTARKQQIERARAAESEVRSILDRAPFAVAMSVAGPGIAWTDARAKVTYANRRFVELLGYEASDVPTVADLARATFPDEEHRLRVFTELDAQVRRAVAGDGGVGPFEVQVRTKDGRELDVVLKATLVADQLVIAIEDHTERIRAQRSLRESEGRLRSVVENTPVPVAYTMSGGRDLGFNKAFTDVYGWTAADLPTLDDWFEKIYPDPDYRRSVLKLWNADVERALRSDGKIVPRLYRVTAKNGSLHEVEITAGIFEGELFGTFVDLTERNRAERLLREHREQIAHVGRVSALGQLAASLAHELDQPLGAVLNNAETARILLSGDNVPVSELREILDDIVADDRRAGQILDRIRAMVRGQPFQAARVEVPSLLKETANFVQFETSRKNIALEVSCDPSLPPVEGDRILLQQALLNLLLNSIEAIGERADGVVFLRAGEEKSGHVGISVGDNGGGMPPDVAAHLLQPFRTTKRGGLGMGLSIVSSIVEEHAGRLRIDNQPGRGLTVSLILSCWRGGESA